MKRLERMIEDAKRTRPRSGFASFAEHKELLDIIDELYARLKVLETDRRQRMEDRMEETR